MPGFHDSAERAPPAEDCSRVGFTLQPRSPTLLLRSGNSGAELGTSAQGASPLLRGGGASHVNARLGRTPP